MKKQAILATLVAVTLAGCGNKEAATSTEAATESERIEQVRTTTLHPRDSARNILVEQSARLSDREYCAIAHGQNRTHLRRSGRP